MTAPTGSASTIEPRSMPSSDPARTAYSATGTRKSICSSQPAPWTDHASASAMTPSRTMLIQPARG